MKKLLDKTLSIYRRFTLPVLALLALGMAASLAAYTNFGYKKGVVSTNGGTAMFHANYLQQCNITAEEKDYAVYPLGFDTDANQAPVTFTLVVDNHAPSDVAQPNPQDITYTLKMQISDVESFTGYSIVANGGSSESFGSNGSYTHKSTLKGGALNSDTYQVTMPYADIAKVRFITTATPDAKSLNYVYQKQLAAVLTTSFASSASVGLVYRASFPDQTTANAPNSFHALNYEILGISGAGKLTLTWDTTYVDLDKYAINQFVLDQNGTPATESNIITNALKKSLTFYMDSQTTSYYLLQFFLEQSPLPENWDAVNNYISCVAAPKS